MSHLTAYYRLEKLPEEIKAQFKIRSKPRLDCVESCHLLNEQPFSQFINKKGQMYFYCTDARNFVKANSKRMADKAITQGRKNLSSIYIPNIEHPEFAYGDVNGANDGLLFKLNDDLSIIDIFLIKNGKNLIQQFYQLFIDGELDEEIEQLKQQAKPFFNYQKTL